MLIDFIIIAFAISALYRGREIGFVRQVSTALGFFGGLFLGAALGPIIGRAFTASPSEVLTRVVFTLGLSIMGLLMGEYVGFRLKHRLLPSKLNHYDGRLGSAVNVITLLISAWLIAAVVSALPVPRLQADISGSHLVRALDKVLPPAPKVIADLGKLISPNGFPQVFIGNEPLPKPGAVPQSLGDLRGAVAKDQVSVVKIQGQGCGGIVDGSGFVAGPGLVATNAHVVAGIRHPFVQDSNGVHRGTVVLFDPNLDFAVLRVNGLAGAPLQLAASRIDPGTPAAVLGYPGGGPFEADPAAVMDIFRASGRNIYGRGTTLRSVYELRAKVIPGNSGGPLIAQDGSVIGVVFAESTSYNQVGYALTSPTPLHELNQVNAQSGPVSTGSCAE